MSDDRPVDGEGDGHVQARVGFNTANGKVLLGAWGHYARMHTDTPVGGATDFDSQSYGGDVDLRLTPHVSVKGEAWAGKNLADVRGGSGQSLNTANGEEIAAKGGWVELGLRKGLYGFTTGYTIDDPQDNDVPVAGITQNRAWYVANQIQIPRSPVTAGIDYTYWQTTFKDATEGADNRVNIYIMYTY